MASSIASAEQKKEKKTSSSSTYPLTSVSNKSIYSDAIFHSISKAPVAARVHKTAASSIRNDTSVIFISVLLMPKIRPLKPNSPYSFLSRSSGMARHTVRGTRKQFALRFSACENANERGPAMNQRQIIEMMKMMMRWMDGKAGTMYQPYTIRRSVYYVKFMQFIFHLVNTID